MFADSNDIRTVAEESEIRTRECRDCGSELRLYEGPQDQHGQESTYIFRNKVKTFAKDYKDVKQAIQQLKPELKAENTTIGKIAPKTAKLVSTEEINEK